MNIFMRVTLAVNQSVCLIITGQNDLTISCWSYLRHIEHGKSWWFNFVNGLFFWQEDHCLMAFNWELNSAKKLHYKLHDVQRRRDGLIK